MFSRVSCFQANPPTPRILVRACGTPTIERRIVRQNEKSEMFGRDSGVIFGFEQIWTHQTSALQRLLMTPLRDLAMVSTE